MPLQLCYSITRNILAQLHSTLFTPKLTFCRFPALNCTLSGPSMLLTYVAVLSVFVHD